MRTLKSVEAVDVTKHLLAAIIESYKDSMISVIFDGIISSRYPAAELLYGYSTSGAIGKHLRMLWLPEDLKETLVNIDKIKYSGKIEIFETKRVGKDGQHPVLEATMPPDVVCGHFLTGERGKSFVDPPTFNKYL